MYQKLNKQFKITEQEFKLLKSKDIVNITCSYCDVTYTRTKHETSCILRKNKTGSFYCSKTCSSLVNSKKQEINCKQCNKSIVKKLTDIRRSENHFCSQSCAASFNNKLRTKEVYEKQAESVKNTFKKFYYYKKYYKFSYVHTLQFHKDVLNTYLLSKRQSTTKHTCICETCNITFISVSYKRKTCSKECLYKRFSQIHIDNPHILNNRNASESYLEKSFREYIETKGYVKNINYEQEKTFKIKLSTSEKLYYADFYFPELNLIIEMDGSQHQETIEEDLLRDNHFNNIGIKTIRITHKEWKLKSKESLLSTMLNF